MLSMGATALSAQDAHRVGDAASVAQASTLLASLVAINTTRERGSTTPAARLLADRFLEAGWPRTDVEVVGPSPNRQNLVVRWRAQSPTARPVLFMSHLDVVEARRDDWDSDPFILREKDGYLYGRGVLDDKAAVATWTTGLISLRREGWRPSRDIVLLLTADEEGGTENGVEWMPDGVRSLLTRAVASSWGPKVRVQTTLSLGASDASFTRASGIPSFTLWHVPLDPADMRAHGRDERIRAKSFDESVEFARSLIREAAGGPR